MNSPSPRVEEIFRAALALPSEDREAFVAVSALGDTALIAEVQRLLAASEPPISEPAPELPPGAAEDFARLKPEEPGDVIGPYKLMEQIGEGGFGTVWVAAQERPVRRRVALKVIKLGMDTKDVIARFEQERQALAVMDHPHIAKVLDAGATQWGRPYFVMELVRGIKVTEYCDQANLTTAERIQLFIQVCHAVQHAHQKGIIHRDLKPSNILVTLHDGLAVPKVIDFGVAKATQQQRFTDLTIYTQFQQMIGTPLYMSPEQAEMSGLDIDTRSDIYSLGVLLYELITGRTPFDPEVLLKQGLDEIRHAIREVEPQTPSTFIRDLPDATRAAVAQHRRTEPAKLARLVRGDLDWIVMKAIEKDRSRRYETANGLAMDLRRYLASEPVVARPPSRLYRLRRLARRNRAVFVGGAAVIAALIGGLGVATHALINERAARAGEKAQRVIADERTRQAQISAEAAAASEAKGRRFLYAADMGLAQQSIEVNNFGRARQLLDRHRPAPGETDLRGWEWRYLWQQCRIDARALLTKREASRAFSHSFSPDGRWLALGFFDGQVEIWDVAQRQRHKLLQEKANLQAHVGFSPRGDVVAATLGRDSVKLYSLETGAVTDLCALTGAVTDLSFSPDGEWVAVLSLGPEMVQIFRVADSAVVFSHRISEYRNRVAFFNDVRISPDKQRIYFSCGAFQAPKVRCISIQDQRTLWEIGDVPPDTAEEEEWRDTGFMGMDLSPDGQTLVVSTGYERKFARVLDANTGRLLKTLRAHQQFVSDLEFSRDGKWLATSSSDQTLRLWNTATWESQAEPFRGHGQEVHGLALTRDGELLASGSKDGEVLLWDVHAPRLGKGRKRLPSHIDTAFPLPVGDMAICRLTDQRWSLLSLLTFEEQEIPATEISPVDNHPLISPTFFPPSRRVPAVKREGFQGVWDKAALSPDRKLVAVPSESGLVGLYEPHAVTPREILRGSMPTVFRAAFSGDNQRLILSNGGGHSLALWDLTTRQELITVSASDSMLTTLRVGRDGNTIFVKSSARPVDGVGACQVWRAPSWAEIEEAEGNGARWSISPTRRPAPRPPTFVEVKRLMEEYLRRQLADANAGSDPIARDEALGELAYFLNRQDRPAEAEPLLRELLARYEQQYPASDPILAQVTSALLDATMRLTRARLRNPGTAAADAQSLSENPPDHAWQAADALVNKILGFLIKIAEHYPDDSHHSLNLAALHVWFGRDAEYVRIGQSLLTAAEADRAPAIAKERAATVWCLRSNSDPALLARALRLAQHAVELDESPAIRGWLQRSLGMAEYRSGNYAAAEQAFLRAQEWAEDSTRQNPKLRPALEGISGLFRAMIRHRNGEFEEARNLFAAAERQVHSPPADRREVLLNGAVVDDLMFWLIYKEAKALLASAPAGADAKLPR